MGDGYLNTPTPGDAGQLHAILLEAGWAEVHRFASSRQKRRLVLPPCLVYASKANLRGPHAYYCTLGTSSTSRHVPNTGAYIRLHLVRAAFHATTVETRLVPPLRRRISVSTS